MLGKDVHTPEVAPPKYIHHHTTLWPIIDPSTRPESSSCQRGSSDVAFPAILLPRRDSLVISTAATPEMNDPPGPCPRNTSRVCTPRRTSDMTWESRGDSVSYLDWIDRLTPALSQLMKAVSQLMSAASRRLLVGALDVARARRTSETTLDDRISRV